MWRDWFTFTRQDRRAIILLSVIIAVVGGILYTHQPKNDEQIVTAKTDSIANTLIPTRKESPIIKIERHSFDPNRADSMELLTLGLSPYVTRNIIRYRQAGGRFRQPEDLARIYGMHDTVYAQLKPYIDIPQEKKNPETPSPKPTTQKTKQESRQERVSQEHPYAEYMRNKLKPGQTVDLNTADTTELMKIPGIGSVYASMIVNYRQQLGGFHSTTQLNELNGIPQLNDWVIISTPQTEKLRINKLSVTHLRSHPYLTFYQAKAIVELRQREGDIKSLRQLLFLDEFTEADIERLKPYISFE